MRRTYALTRADRRPAPSPGARRPRAAHRRRRRPADEPADALAAARPRRGRARRPPVRARRPWRAPEPARRRRPRRRARRHRPLRPAPARLATLLDPESGTVRLAFLDSMATSLVPRLLHDFRSVAPHTRVVLRQ